MPRPTNITATPSGSVASHGPRRVRRRSCGKVQWTFLAFAVPALVIYGGFLLGPVLSGFFFSLTRWNGIAPPTFIGFENFVRLAGDRRFFEALLHTLAYAGVILVGQMVLGLAFALLLNRASKGVAVMRGVFFAPSLLSTAVIAFVWGFIYNPLVGVLLQIAEGLGLNDSALSDVLGNQNTALLGVCVVVIWQWAGYFMVIFLAGLKSIPGEVYEAAALDGASAFKQFWHVTWPLLAPSTSIAITLSLAGNLRLFDIVYLLTAGGPGGSTESVGTLIYRTAFTTSEFGYSTAQSVVLTFLVAAIVVAQRWLSGRSTR